jgi:hypothetical protein
MSKDQEVENVYASLKSIYKTVHEIIGRKEVDLGDEFKKINYTYYRMFGTHLESFGLLVEQNYYSSAILLLRTMLELHVKSYYFEFIEKKAGAKVVDFLDGKKDFPNFFKMTQALEAVENATGDKFSGAFSQFGKSELASYEKFSLFSHGRGELLRLFFDSNKITYSSGNILEVLLNAKALFESLTLLFLGVQGRRDELGYFIELIKNESYFRYSNNPA